MFDVGCHAADAASSAFEQIARAAGEAAGELIGKSFTWWIDTDSVNPDSEVVRNLQRYTVPVALVVLTGSVLVQSIRMILTRKKDPALNVGLGLIRYAVVTAVGLSLLAGALRAGDDFSSWMVDQAVGDFAQRLAALLGGDVIENAFMLLILALVGLVLAAIQWVLAFIRQAGILVLAVMLPLAASGSINDSTKVWLSRLMPWLIALVLYKPMAALIYTIGFTMLGQGDDFTTVMTGLMVMVLAVIAMPAMLRFFSWSQVTATGGSGVGGALAAGASGAASMAALRSARSMQMTGPGSAPSGSAGSSGSSGQLVPAGSGGGPAGGGSAGGGGPSGGGPSGGPGGGTPGPGAGGSGPSGAGGAREAGVPSARGGGGVAAGAGQGGASSSGGGAAAGGAAAGGAAAAGAAVARGAYQAGQAAADKFTGGEQQ